MALKTCTKFANECKFYKKDKTRLNRQTNFVANFHGLRFNKK